MAVLKLSACTGVAAVVVASLSTNSNRTYADSSFRFSPFSYSNNQTEQASTSENNSNSSEDDPKDSSTGFDAESLERGAKALREINNSPHAKQVFDLMRKQEQTRLAELSAEKAHYEAIQSHSQIEKQQKMGEEQRNLLQQQAQTKAQILRYEDELSRKRMQTDHEAQRRNNVELVNMQEQSSMRKEQTRQSTEQQIQNQQRQTEKERAEIERETIRVKAMAEAEGRAHEAKLTEDHNKKMLMERMNGEKEKWLAAINTTFSHIGGGVRTLLTDRSKLLMTVGGTTALAAGIYTTREGAKVTWGYINRILGQPSLIRESSISRFPWSRMNHKASNYSTAAGAQGNNNQLKNIILHPSLQRRVEQLARATANTKSHQAPFRNMLFYGPPGTGKTLVARDIAQKSGLDYAMMTGGDVAPLAAQAVTKIHEIFDWSKKSRKGLLLFIDEADAFLCERNSTYMSEAQRSALNALLFRTGDQSKDVVLVLATNRPGDLDRAIADRMDEVIEFPLPGQEERFKLLKLYLDKYVRESSNGDSGWVGGFRKRAATKKISVKDDVDDGVLEEAARRTDGFSGREIAKLMAGIQAAVYGRSDCVLDARLFTEVVDYKVEERKRRIKLAADSAL